MSKPVIGVMPLVDYQRESYWMLPGYYRGIQKAGGIPLMMPLTNSAADIAQLLSLVDGLLITGGQDVSPGFYGDSIASNVPTVEDASNFGDTAPEGAISTSRGIENGAQSPDSRSITSNVHAPNRAPAFDGTSALVGETSPERDAMERLLITAALKADIPLLGICRGIQVLNVLCGGTLWQDLPTQHPGGIDHHGKPPYSTPAHNVEVLAETPLSALVGAGKLPVNSYHHQAIRDLAPGLFPMAVAPDGIIEAVWRPASYFCWALQWHPEFSFENDAASLAIFKAFVGSTRSQLSHPAKLPAKP